MMVTLGVLFLSENSGYIWVRLLCVSKGRQKQKAKQEENSIKKKKKKKKNQT